MKFECSVIYVVGVCVCVCVCVCVTVVAASLITQDSDIVKQTIGILMGNVYNCRLAQPFCSRVWNVLNQTTCFDFLSWLLLCTFCVWKIWIINCYRSWVKRVSDPKIYLDWRRVFSSFILLILALHYFDMKFVRLLFRLSL